MKSFFAAAFFGLLMAGAGSAATTSYTNATAFAAAAGTLQLENFRGEVRGSSLAGTRDFGGFTTTLNSSVTDPAFNVVGGPSSLNSAGLPGTNLQIGLLEGETFTFTFDSAITAFGALFANVNDFFPRSTFSGGGTTDWLPVVNRFGARFFGIVSDTPFTTVTITGGLFTEGFGIDNVRWAAAPVPTPVPLPASGILLLGAVLAVGAIGRRRRAQA